MSADRDISKLTRVELVSAREDLKQQLARVAYPVRDPVSPIFQNPALVQRLQATIDEIEACLAEMGPDEA